MDGRGKLRGHPDACGKTANAYRLRTTISARHRFAVRPNPLPPDRQARACLCSCKLAWSKCWNRSGAPRDCPRTRRYTRARTSTAQRDISRDGAAFRVYDFRPTLSLDARDAALSTVRAFFQLLIVDPRA